MKHLQTINEYQRTVGFRYSEPKESYNIDILLNNADRLLLENNSYLIIYGK